MFRKLVSSLPYSPALVGQLGFYARRLRKEEFTRRLGLVFTALALVVQSFVVFNPPEQALASSDSDIIPGGIRTVSQILSVYDAGAAGNNDFKDFMDYVGISRAEIAAMSTNVVYVCSSDHSIISFGRQHHYSTAEGELVHTVPRTTGGYSTFYSVPLYRFDSVNNTVNCYDSFVGNSSKVGWFAIFRKCGNLEIKKNIYKVPRGHLVAASCKLIQGFAYDERQLDQKVKVYLFFGGPPGQGKQFGPLVADHANPTSPVGSGHGFSFSVPDVYQKLSHSTTVWGVLQPLAGWKQPTVQFDNTVTIPGNCVAPETPIASCVSLQPILIDRTHVTFEAKAAASGGAKVTGYTLTVLTKSGNKVYEKTVNTGDLSTKFENIEFSAPGDYSAKVVVKTSIGDRQSTECQQPFTISPPDRCKFSPDILATDESCKPCPYDDTIWIRDTDCRPRIGESKQAVNLTKGLSDINGSLASTTDRIEYTIYTKNLGSGNVEVNVEEKLADVLEYAKLLDNGGGVFNDKTKTLSWGKVTLGAHQTDTRKFVVQVKDKIPGTPNGGNNGASFNCVMTNSYGNTIEVKVRCPLEKQIEGAAHVLPSTGPGENMLFAAGLLMIVTYFYARSRQMGKEVRLIKKEFSGGTI